MSKKYDSQEFYEDTIRKLKANKGKTGKGNLDDQTAKFLPNPATIKERATTMRQLTRWDMSEKVIVAVLRTERMSMLYVKLMVRSYGLDEAKTMLLEDLENK